MDRSETWPPITHEAEATPREMTPEQSEAFERYMEHRPDDPAERERLRGVFQIAARRQMTARPIVYLYADDDASPWLALGYRIWRSPLKRPRPPVSP